jgi:uroporphyrinogen-III synthase
MSKSINIVSTKILSASQKQDLLDANFNVIEADFIKTKNTDFDLNNINDNLIFTSQNAVHSVLAHENVEKLKSKNVFCVGLKTKILLSENGFNAEVYTGYAEDLAEIITLIHSTETFTFFCGNLRRAELPNMLKENGVTFNEVKVYETQLQSHKINEKVDGILFFSPSAVESYLKDNKIKQELCFCIGKTTAKALDKISKKSITAENPSVEDVIEDVIHYYKPA